jgi:putative endonuclease
MPVPEPTFGARCEALAAGYLAGKGLILRVQTPPPPLGEVDLILDDGDTIVFVEVKARRSARYGPGSEAVGVQKQRRLMAIAGLYLAQYPRRACRFDVVSVSVEKGRPQIDHLIDAFP